MKLEKFQGKDDEDFDLWWEDIRAFFALYQINEDENVRLVNSHKGGEARRVVQQEDVESINTLKKLNNILQSTF